MTRQTGFEDVEVFDPRQTYSSAARDYDAAAPGWGRVIGHSLELLRPQPGDTLLDVGCGPGILAVRAAEQVAPDGAVTAVDLSEEMLGLARAKATSAGVADAITFEVGDMHRLRFPDGCFDAVACSFAMFFARDVTAVGRELWRVVAPGGRLVVTTVGEQFFEPMWTQFRAETARVRPQLEIDMPWERRQVSDGGTLCGLLAAGGLRLRRYEAEDLRVPIEHPDDWWRMAAGTGIRRAVEEMGPEAAAEVRAANADWIERHGVDSVTLSTNWVLAERPSAG